MKQNVDLHFRSFEISALTGTKNTRHPVQFFIEAILLYLKQFTYHVNVLQY